MTDALDRLAAPGADLLDRVDRVLVTHGLPTDHPIIDLLRRLGALPTDAFRAISGLRPAPLRAAATELRRTADGYARQRDLLATPVEWTGVAGEQFAVYRAGLVGHLGETGETGGPGLVGRLYATAGYLDDVADWADRSRLDMARALADVLGSAEALRLCAATSVNNESTDAAAVGSRVLSAAAGAHASGLAIAERWAGALDEVPYQLPTAGSTAAGETSLTL